MKYIKYKRFVEEIFEDDDVQRFFDMLITNGWDIIHYSEKNSLCNSTILTVVAGKQQIEPIIL